jgi:hypothetical protein
MLAKFTMKLLLELHTLDENIVVTNLRDWCLLVELERVETILALDRPLLGC